MKIKETRKCAMCVQTFRVLNTSNRKTCCTSCSLKYRQKPEYKAKHKKYGQMYRKRLKFVRFTGNKNACSHS